jgi:hypothetical protein
MPDCWLEVILHSEVPAISHLGTRFLCFSYPGMVSKFPVPSLCISCSLSVLRSSQLTQKTEMPRSLSQATASGRHNDVFISTLPLAEGPAVGAREPSYSDVPVPPKTKRLSLLPWLSLSPHSSTLIPCRMKTKVDAKVAPRKDVLLSCSIPLALPVVSEHCVYFVRRLFVRIW